MTLEKGNIRLDISEQADCMVIIHREYNPYSEETKTTQLLMKKSSFFEMFNPLVDVVSDYEK